MAEGYSKGPGPQAYPPQQTYYSDQGYQQYAPFSNVSSQEGMNAHQGQSVPLRAELKVTNLDISTSEEELRHLFSGMGEVEGVEVISSDGQNSQHSVGSAYVTFKDSNVANDAYKALNGQVFRGKTLVLSWSDRMEGFKKPKWFRIFVGNLPRDVDDDKLKTLFEPYGTILTSKVVCEPQGNTSRGFGFVTFETFDAAKTAIDKMYQAEIDGCALETNWAILRRRNQDDLQQHPKYYEVLNGTFHGNRTVYVGHLPDDVSRDSLQKLLKAAFRRFGRVQRVVVSDCTRYAFVVLDTMSAATCAILGLNGKALCGAGVSPDGGNLKAIKCSWANSQHENRNQERSHSGYPSNHHNSSPRDNSGYNTGAFWTAGGRTRSSPAGFGYRANQQNLMSWFWNVPQGGGYGNPRGQYSTVSSAAPPYGSYYGYNYNYYRGGNNSCDRQMYYSPGSTPAHDTSGSPSSSQQHGRYLSGGGYSRPQQQAYNTSNYSDQRHSSGSGGGSGSYSNRMKGDSSN